MTTKGSHSPDQTLVDRVLGQQLSGFEVIRPIGAGGMGAIFLARQLSVGREVALKVVPEMGHEVTRTRFVREAQSIAKLSHPNIVQLFDYGFDENLSLLYYAMEFVEGETLAQVLRRGRMHPALAVELAMQVCSALAQTHAQGVIHRDLKASNVILMFSADGQVLLKLLDFGIAHTFEDEDHRLTKTGLICGTPAYIAPEQMDGDDPSPQADLYALGVNLHFMLAGRLPFVGRSAIEIVMKQAQGPVPSLQEYADQGLVPASLVGLCEHLMAKTAEERPETAAEVRERLVEIRAELEPRHLKFPAEGDRISRYQRPRLEDENRGVPPDWQFDAYVADEATLPAGRGENFAAPDAETEKIARADVSQSDEEAAEPAREGGGWGAFSNAPDASFAPAEAYEFEPMTGPFKPVSSNPNAQKPKEPEENKLSVGPRVDPVSPLEMANRPKGARRFSEDELVPDLDKLQVSGRPTLGELPQPQRYKITRPGPWFYFVRKIVIAALIVAFAYYLLQML